LVLIMICSLLVGLEVDLKEEESPHLYTFLLHFNTVINLLFLAEIISKVHQVGWDFFGGGTTPTLGEVGWNVLDYLIMSIGIAEILTTYFAPNDPDGAATKALKTFRMARFVRLLKSLRFVQGFTLPAVLADALVVTIPFISAVFVLLFVVLGIGSSMLRKATQPDPVSPDADYNSEWHDHYETYFGTTLRGIATVLTFFTGEGFGKNDGKALVRGGGWSGVLYAESGTPTTRITMLVFATSAACWLCSTCLFSVLTGTITDKVSCLYQQNYGALSMVEKAKEAEVQRRLSSFMEKLDLDGNGLVRRADVLRASDRDHVHSLFDSLGVDRDDIISLFRALDCEGNGTIELSVLQRFCTQIVKGDAQAIHLYKLSTAAAAVSKRVLQISERYTHFLAELDLTVEAVQWHNERYEDVEAVALRAETRAADRSTYLKQRDKMYKSFEHFACRRKTDASSLSSNTWRPRSTTSSGSMRRTRPPLSQAGETTSSFAFRDPASTASTF
jgi:hypothetical protein